MTTGVGIPAAGAFRITTGVVTPTARVVRVAASVQVSATGVSRVAAGVRTPTAGIIRVATSVGIPAARAVWITAGVRAFAADTLGAATVASAGRISARWWWWRWPPAAAATTGNPERVVHERAGPHGRDGLHVVDRVKSAGLGRLWIRRRRGRGHAGEAGEPEARDDNLVIGICCPS
jgi:hypothetical protein